MDKLTFTFSVKAHAVDPKTSVIALTYITTEKDKHYIMPEQYQTMEHHKELTNTTAYRRVLNTLKKRGQTRKVHITLPKDILDLYQDEEGNMIFKEYLLEEVLKIETIEQKTTPSQQTSAESGRQNLKKLSEKFVIEKFSDKTSNRSEWMNTFERECSRLGIEKDSDKIETIRLFLEDSGADWYNGTLAILTMESKWPQWKQRFNETFTDKGWLPITQALSYRYLTGSLLSYALKKRNLLIQANKAFPESALIDLIGVGLPNFIKNRIDKQKLKTVENLFSEIGALEHLVRNVGKKTPASQEKKPKDKPSSYKPCTICESKGKSNRFHPESTCWYKEKNNERKKLELVKHVNNSELEVELNDCDQKN